jgi:hypothetical protein
LAWVRRRCISTPSTTANNIPETTRMIVTLSIVTLPSSIDCGPEHQIQSVPVVRLAVRNKRGLLDRFAPALNQNCQHNHKKNAAYDTNDQNAVHFGSPFL